MMSTRLVSFFNGRISLQLSKSFIEMMIDDTQWAKKMRKIHKFLDQCDTVKHLPPRFARSMQTLVEYINETYVTQISITYLGFKLSCVKKSEVIHFKCGA